MSQYKQEHGLYFTGNQPLGIKADPERDSFLITRVLKKADLNGDPPKGNPDQLTQLAGWFTTGKLAVKAANIYSIIHRHSPGRWVGGNFENIAEAKQAHEAVLGEISVGYQTTTEQSSANGSVYTPDIIQVEFEDLFIVASWRNNLPRDVGRYISPELLADLKAVKLGFGQGVVSQAVEIQTIPQTEVLQPIAVV